MATDSIDKELLENGVKDTITADIEQEYNSSFNEMSADSSKANIARCLRLIYTSFKTASGNDKILRKMYKDLKKKYLEQKKVNKNLKNDFFLEYDSKINRGDASLNSKEDLKIVGDEFNNTIRNKLTSDINDSNYIKNNDTFMEIKSDISSGLGNKCTFVFKKKIIK